MSDATTATDAAAEAEYDRRETELRAAVAAQTLRTNDALLAFQAEYRVLAALERELYYLPLTHGKGPT